MRQQAMILLSGVVCAALCSGPALARGMAGAAPGGAASPGGVGPSGPTGNASFVAPGALGIPQGVGPSGPIGNASMQAANGTLQTNGNIGIFPTNLQSRDFNSLNNGAGLGGFSIQGFGFGLGGFPNGFPYYGASEDEQKRLREQLRHRLTTPSVVPVSTRIQHRGANVVAVKEQLIDGKMVRTEGTMIQEYGAPRSATRVANRQVVKTHTFARVIPAKKKHCSCSK